MKKRMIAFLLIVATLGMFAPGGTGTAQVFAAGSSSSSQQLAITKQPASKTVKSGKNATFSVTATGSSLKYQWHYKKSGSGSWTKWKNKTSAKLSFTANDSWDGASFYCKVTDGSNNSVGSKSAKLTVEKGFDDEDQKWLNNQAASVLKKIITKDMNGMQKAYAIYYWTKNHISYSGSSDKSDYRIAAMDGFLKKSGDCFTYFAVSKVLLNQAGIKNKDMVKLRKSDKESRHYWSLINVGSGWYHFDCTRFRYAKANFFMVTDKELKKWDRTYYPNAHRYSSNGVPKLATKSVQSMVNYSSSKLTVAKELKITKQPANKTVKTGKTAKFSVSASGSKLKYQWYYKKKGAKSWTKWKNKTKSSVSLKATSSWNGASFYCKVTDGSNNSVGSRSAKLTVKK